MNEKEKSKSYQVRIDPSLTDKVEKYVDEDYFNMENEEDKKRFDYLCSLEVSKITFTRVVNDFSCKYLV